MKMFLFAAFSTVIFSSVLTINAQSCSLDLSTTDLVVTDRNYKVRLPATNKTEINFAYQEKLMIKCPPGSTSPVLSDDGESGMCSNGTALQLDRTHGFVYFDIIKCIQKLPATVKVSTTSCQHGGTHLEIGLEMLGQFITIYTVCFDESTLVPLNATYSAPFDQWGAFSNEPTDHYFADDAHLYMDVDLDRIYNNQNRTFTNWGVPEYYTDEIYLIKGQLLPSYLFSYSLENYASFNYANVVAQWSTFRNVFAEFVNNFIVNHMMEPSVYQVGTFGVATLKKSGGSLVKLNLVSFDRQVPVPRWLWFNQPDSFTIYGYNNPYYEDSEVEAEFKEMCLLPVSVEKFKDMWVGICAGDPSVAK